MYPASQKGPPSSSLASYGSSSISSTTRRLQGPGRNIQRRQIQIRVQDIRREEQGPQDLDRSSFLTMNW